MMVEFALLFTLLVHIQDRLGTLISCRFSPPAFLFRFVYLLQKIRINIEKKIFHLIRYKHPSTRMSVLSFILMFASSFQLIHTLYDALDSNIDKIQVIFVLIIMVFFHCCSSLSLYWASTTLFFVFFFLSFGCRCFFLFSPVGIVLFFSVCDQNISSTSYTKVSRLSLPNMAVFVGKKILRISILFNLMHIYKEAKERDMWVIL